MQALSDRAARSGPTAAVIAGSGACALIALRSAPRNGIPPSLGLLDAQPSYFRGNAPTLATVIILLLPALGTLLGLLFPRYWSYLLLAGAVLGLPATAAALWSIRLPIASYDAALVAPPLLLIGALAAAQELVRSGAVGCGAALAGCSFGAELFGQTLTSGSWPRPDATAHWFLGLTVIGLAGVVVGVVRFPRGGGIAARPRGESVAARPDSESVGVRTGRDVGWWRYVAAGTVAAALPAVPGTMTLATWSHLLGVPLGTLNRRYDMMPAIAGTATLVICVLLAVGAGVWSLSAALIAGTLQVAMTAPMLLAVYALDTRPVTGWVTALIGVALGAAAVVSRRRIALAVGATILAGVSLFVAYAATTGDPAKIDDQHLVVPGILLLALLTATGTAVIGSTAPVLAGRGGVPAILGVLVVELAVAGRQALGATYVDYSGRFTSTTLEPVHHLATSATLLLVAAAGLGGLALAKALADRRADRLHTEKVRAEAAEAERNRLARPIHDGVLQVLTLVRRHGSELGGRGPELAELAGAQEVALRTLISSPAPGDGRSTLDIRTLLALMVTPAIEVSAPASPVLLSAHAARELYAAAGAAIDNVRKHAGARARAWVFVEQEPDGVRVTVRDDGPGIAPGRLAEAAADGRLGVAQSIRGRITDLGGNTTITSAPGQGTEIEFWVPHR